MEQERVGEISQMTTAAHTLCLAYFEAMWRPFE